MKVVHQLGRGGFIETVRGKGGGLRLAMAANEIVLGDVIRHTESDFNLVECFASNATCRIQGRAA
jgi:Rrf2 family nitric oxide-sensitive transcriptional repressor